MTPHDPTLERAQQELERRLKDKPRKPYELTARLKLATTACLEATVQHIANQSLPGCNQGALSVSDRSDW